uniref:F-box domain-containing protein n=1 Tax=Triticum urartu TaxID=4572 RepID=A0A8R7RCB4_TRIUA
MARRRRDRFLRRRRRPQAVAVHGDDRISALSDDLLLDILGRLDTRTVLDAGVLSKCWAGLPRELSVLDLSIGDILPPRYHHWVLLHRESKERDLKYQFCTTNMEKVMPHIRRYERRTTQALTTSIECLLDPAADGVGRTVSKLMLEFFSTHNTDCINRLISKAIDAWEVHDLVAVAKPVYSQCRNFHAFPGYSICEEPCASRLRSLKLGGCMIPSLLGHNVLTVLVLQDTPMSTPESAYEGIFTSCPQLQVLHLISCYSAGNGNGDITVDALGSDLWELVVDNCVCFTRICLRALPRLERLASLGTRVRFETTSFPYLRQCNLTLCMGVTEETARRYFAARM